MKYALAMLLAFVTTAASAQSPRCYRLSHDGTIFSRTPEIMCVAESGGKAKITFQTGHVQERKLIAQYNLDLLERARCIDCNADLFGVAIPSNSIFNDMMIRFDGRGARGAEEGTVKIGENLFYYVSF